MNKKLYTYAGVILILLFAGSGSALIDLTGTYTLGGGGNPFNQDLNNTASPTFVDLTVTDDIDVADDIYLFDRIYHTGDLDTYIAMAENSWVMQAGGEGFSLTTTRLEIGDSMGDDLDVLVYDSNGNYLFFVDSGNARVSINDPTPDQPFDINGNTNITGDLNVTGITNSSGGFETDTGTGWSGTFTVDEGEVTVRYGIIIDVDWD